MCFKIVCIMRFKMVCIMCFKIVCIMRFKIVCTVLCVSRSYVLCVSRSYVLCLSRSCVLFVSRSYVLCVSRSYVLYMRFRNDLNYKLKARHQPLKSCICNMCWCVATWLCSITICFQTNKKGGFWTSIVEFENNARYPLPLSYRVSMPTVARWLQNWFSPALSRLA